MVEWSDIFEQSLQDLHAAMAVMERYRQERPYNTTDDWSPVEVARLIAQNRATERMLAKLRDIADELDLANEDRRKHRL